LKDTQPPKPGLERVKTGGYAIEIEIWELSVDAFGAFVSMVSSPLGIGTLFLENGTTVKGFICEPFALIDALDISHWGGWRAYLQSLNPAIRDSFPSN
jgi:allophanate hydrolase